jgi:lysine 2,3-aminomutase
VVDLVQGGGKVPMQPNYVLSQTKDELILKNYEGNVYRYRNPGPQIHGKVTIKEAPISVAVESLLADTQIKLETEGTIDADRVIVRS